MVDKNQNRKQMQKQRNKVRVEEQINNKEKRKKIKQVKGQMQKTKRKQADDKSARVKKVKSIRKVFTWTILIGMLVGILVFLCESEMFDICNIEVTGNNQISKEIILELSQIDLNDNIFLTNAIKAKNKINENPYIKEVEIKRVLPDKIKIEIVEKEKAYILELDGTNAYIDNNGDILEISTTKIEGLIILQGYTTLKENIEVGKTLNEEDVERLEDIQQILKSGEKAEIHNKIASININDKNDYTLNLPDYKKIVYIGDTGNLATKMLRTKDILNKTMGLEGKIFVNGKFNKGFDPYFREEPNN